MRLPRRHPTQITNWIGRLEPKLARLILPGPTDHPCDAARTGIDHDDLVVRRHEVAVAGSRPEPANGDVAHRGGVNPLWDHAAAAHPHPAALRIAWPRGEQHANRDTVIHHPIDHNGHPDRSGSAAWAHVHDERAARDRSRDRADSAHSPGD